MATTDRSRAPKVLACVALIAILFVIGQGACQGPTVAERAPINVSMQRAIGLGKAVRFWSLENEDKPPPSLNDPGFVEALGAEPDKLLYRDPETGRLLDWLYFPRNFNGSVDQILIASPISSKGMRIVVYADCSGGIIKDEEFSAIYPSAASAPAASPSP